MIRPRRSRPLAAAIAAAVAALALAAGRPGPSRYLEDFDFIARTVARRGAAVASKKIPWERECARLRPLFARCKSDAEHVRNVMQLLAVLRDGHTGVTRHAILAAPLPSKWDGLYGGGLWLAWDRGRVVVRGITKGHPLEGSLPCGSIVAGIGGEPTWLALAREERRIKRFQGVSSDHSLFASLANRMFPFGNRRTLEIVVRTPAGKLRSLELPRWGGGGGGVGKAFDPIAATLPEGVARAKGACAGTLRLPWCRRVGYLRITGGMNRTTAAAFHHALDSLRGVEALLLDCRGMGGGGDDAAWEMTGRFFPGGVPNGRNGRIEPSGSWQFDGPLVLLQDETEVSSAETFTWALSETGRAVTVGRPTGGWSILPAGFTCPSGLLSFRLGVTDRPTPIRGVHTEGVGWPPDVLVPYGPVFCARPDPVRDVGMEVLALLHAGVSGERAARLFADLFAGRVAGFRKEAGALGKGIAGWDPEGLATRVLEGLRATLEGETALLCDPEAPPPDVLGATARLEELAPRAKAAGLTAALARLQGALRRRKDEGEAQRALLGAGALDDDFRLPDRARKAYLRRYGKTRIGRLVAERF